MVAISSEVDDDDVRIREGLLDKTLDFNSVHGHHDALQRSVAAAMQAPNQLAKYPPKPAGLGRNHRDPGDKETNSPILSQDGAPIGVRFPTCGTRPVGDATWFAEDRASTSDFVDISCFPHASRLLLSWTGT